MADEKPLCFIVGPIGSAGSPERRVADFLMELVIKPTLEAEEFGYEVRRADQDADPGSITGKVIQDIIDADLVVADLTGFNPNVFYEMGIRHREMKPIVHMICEQVKLPFDNQDQRTIFVDFTDVHDIKKGCEKLASSVRAIRKEGYKVSNPITQAIGVQQTAQQADTPAEVLQDILSRLSEVEGHVRRSQVKGSLGISNDAFVIRTTHSDQASEKLYNDYAEKMKAATSQPSYQELALALATLNREKTHSSND